MSGGKASSGLPANQEDYGHRLVRNMDEFRHKKQLCDVTVWTEGKHFRAHKLVLAASSSFFQSLFTVDMKEKQQQKVEMNNINASVMARVLDYIYTGMLSSVSPSEARELYTAADYLLLPELKHMTTEALEKSLSPQNCLRTMEWSYRCSCRSLLAHAFRFALNNFNRVSRTNDFLKLKPQQLRLILSSDNLKILEEEDVYEALKRWTEHRTEERQPFFAELFQLVRLEHVSGFFIEHVIYQDILRLGDDQLQGNVLDTLAESSISEYSLSVINPLRPPRGQVAVVITVLAPDVYCYIPTTKQWLEMAPVPTLRIHSSSVMCSGMLYSVGGLADNEDSSNVVECFDPSANAWFSKDSLPVPTRAAGLAVLGGLLYVVGGRSNSARFNIVQRFDPYKNNWTLVASLLVPRSGTALASCHGKLYAIGGRKDERTFLRSVECYCPEMNTWSLIAPMNVARASSAAVSNEDKIYVIGGVRSPGVSHNSCEVYDVIQDQWYAIAETVVPRSFAGIASFNECLLVCGGEDSGNFHDTVECYDVEQDNWQVVDKMPVAEKFVDCCSMFMSKDLLPVFPCVKYG